MSVRQLPNDISSIQNDQDSSSTTAVANCRTMHLHFDGSLVCILGHADAMLLRASFRLPSASVVRCD